MIGFSASFFMLTAATALRLGRGASDRVLCVQPVFLSHTRLKGEGCAACQCQLLRPYLSLFFPLLGGSPSRAGFFSLGCVGWTC
jgi:hypothetical protein